MHEQVAKAFRVRGPVARAWYVRARRAGRFLRDRERRAAVHDVSPAWHIADDRGLLVLPPSTFAEVADVITTARGWLDRFQPAQLPRGKNRKRFLQNLIDQATLDRGSPLLRLALRDDVLATVADYLGVAPVLSAVSVFLSASSDPEPKSSQLYHCDGDDVRQVKVFVYCSDVEMPSGPLTVLDAHSTAQVLKVTHYQFRQRLTDGQVHAVVGAHQEQPIVGPAGTTALVDTSRCLHFGSRVAADAPPRLVVMMQYQTPYSFMLPGATRPFRHLASGSLSRLQRMALAD